MKITLLGTGTSTGIPIIGCTCPTCTSTDPRDTRLRTSCHVQVEDLSIVIDTGPDFRRQMLCHQITHIDAVLWTHHHFDHIVGLDDLRPFCFGIDEPVPCYTHPHSAGVLKGMFKYAFSNAEGPANLPRLKLQARSDPFWVTSRRELTSRAQVIPIEVEHGRLRINGYRIGDFSYLTDTSAIPPAAMDQLDGTDVLVLDALRHKPHPKHLSFSEAEEIAYQVGARRTVFTHMTHDILHAKDDAELPPGIELGYDGLVVDVDQRQL